MEGMLAMCGSSAEGLIINIWVMQDYKAQVWESKYRITLLVPEPPPCPLSSLKGLFKVAVVNERELLIQFPDADLKLFDIDGELIGDTRSGLGFWMLTSHFLQVNITPLPLFEMQDHGANEEPPSSTTTMYAICYRTILLLVSRCGWAMFFLLCIVCRYLGA
jgi:hypothetical protein